MGSPPFSMVWEGNNNSGDTVSVGCVQQGCVPLLPPSSAGEEEKGGCNQAMLSGQPQGICVQWSRRVPLLGDLEVALRIPLG